MRPRWTRLLAVLAIGAMTATGCGSSTTIDVRSGNASPVAMGPDDPALTTTVPDTSPDTQPDSTVPDTSPDTEPDSTVPDTSPDTSPDTEPGTTVVDDGPVFHMDTDKPAQAYDNFLEKAINDIQRFWRITYPEVYGRKYTELAGGIYAVYPGRTDVPGGCGMRRTTYEDVQGNAFYCGEGDFIAYDDADLLPAIDTDVGRFALAVVIAHEWGHAIQDRARFSGETLLLEQQADCFAGAWVRFVADGKGAYIKFNDNDLNVSMNGLIAVRDEPGEVSRNPNAHGSAFDRVGAFQEGWFGGAARCRDFDTDAPPTTLLPFTTDEEQSSGGNAPYGEIVDLLQTGLDNVWTNELASEGKAFTPPAIDVGDDDTAGRCDDTPDNALKIAFYCPSSNSVIASDRRLRQLYDTFGDNAVGIIVASAYSEAVQRAIASGLEGEPRALADDCLTGAWTAQLFPGTATEPPTISAGDLDEGIQTLIAIGDPTADTNERGSPFEKIDAFRTGVLSGVTACIAKISG